MNLDLLRERHNLKVGDDVIVTERQYPHPAFKGSIYRIVNKSANENIQEYKHFMVDHFYIQVSKEDYDKRLVRGLDVIYEHQPVVLGNIQRDTSGNIVKLYTQQPFMPETEIHLDGINAMLCWRIAYEIKKAI